MELLQTLFALLLTVFPSFCQYQITFDTNKSPPPLIPLEPKEYVYSAPLNQMISKPIIAYIEFKNGSRITDGSLSSEIYEVSTVDEKTAQSPKITDSWAASGGKLCQKAVWWYDYPRRLRRDLRKERCGSNLSSTTLLVKAFAGKIILDWIYHKHSITPSNRRRFLISLPRKSLKVFSNLFLVTPPAHHLTITQEPPLTVTANHDFRVTAEIRFINDSIVNSGLDSALNVDLTIPYYFKVFSNLPDRRMLLKKTLYRLSGKGVTLHQGTYDFIMRKQAVNGRVVFDGIRILDPGLELRLNLTMTMIRDPWMRVPNCSTCYDDLMLTHITEDKKEIKFLRPDIYLLRKLNSVKLTRKFDVLEQKLHKLIIGSESLKYLNEIKDPVNNLIPITRNIEIPGDLRVIAVDDIGRRMYAGKESYFQFIYKTIPTSVCISMDVTKSLDHGSARMHISFCQIIDNVTLEIIPNIRANASVFTPHFKVEGILTVAHFGDFRYSGDGAQVQSHTNSFIRFAASDINNGYVLPFLSRQGFVFRVSSYETESDMHKAYLSFLNITNKRLQKHKAVLIISSTTEAITNVINPELWLTGMNFISTSNTGGRFSNKGIYPYFNRVCWSDNEIFKSVLIACKERMWNMLVIVKQKDVRLHETFYRLAQKFDISIKGFVEIDISSVLYGEISRFEHEMRRLKSFGTKIFYLVATKFYQPYILRAAQLANMDSLHGYQWILVSTYAWQFPFANEQVCQVGIPCTKAFKGTYLFSETYNISGYHTKDWIRVLGYHFSVDRFNYKGGRVKYRPPEVGAKMALGYDALLLFANAVQKVVAIRETMHAKKIADMSRNLQVDGLTGKFTLNSKGDRIGYFGFLAQVNPMDEDKTEAHISMMVTFTRTLKSVSDDTQQEIPYRGWRPDVDPQDPKSKAVLPISSKYNLRVFQSISGVVNQFTQTITINPSEPWPSIKYLRQENVIPLYYCEQKCGKNILSVSDINVYDTGVCEISGRCVCNTGFQGNFCEIIDCKCKYGTCISAYHCSCFPGWRGLECNKAICKKCINGICQKPNYCHCISSSYFGEACDFHISIVLAPLFIGSIIIVFVVILVARYILKHSEYNAALANTDWIIDWSTVIPLVEDPWVVQNSITDITTAAATQMNTFLWKNEKWYGKQISSWTLDFRIPELRMEMVELVKINHRNLIKYVGACLTAPNVCFFMEIADKGSLNDVLINSSIDLGWEFKYSFMRDICSGMRFLHEKTSFQSHGRLKSHNCLIDSRWTVRISGFGAKTIRFGRYRLPNEVKEDLRNLFWTAPEFLEIFSSLDEVRNGSIAGDIYSFAIIVTEILTRAEPYEYELNYISEDIIIDMISNNDTRIRKASQKTWEDIGGADMFVCRPIIRDKFLPKSSFERKQLLKMLDETWNESPSARPSFEKLENILNNIHPVKGELIDNLISLLELYSTNLEMIVIERTKELEVSKARAEQLLSQMLPKKVTAELKKGRKVPPEIFSTATVFFSDIVDFSTICHESSPLQIVDFLNETYKTFDEVLDTYNVYKVETISDSYMVVSGVPEKNGIKHASEIATMALHLMSTVTTFQIPHRPKSTLQLRIGINSGPVVAGVVGVLMPRYCLFGDTVNTASRMESSSLSLCIQASDTTAELLDEIGGFEMECRGSRPVKGRGVMTTYWIWGKDDFEMPMPDQSLAISVSQHKFK